MWLHLLCVINKGEACFSLIYIFIGFLYDKVLPRINCLLHRQPLTCQFEQSTLLILQVAQYLKLIPDYQPIALNTFDLV